MRNEPAVLKALPGTLPEIMKRTGLGAAEVCRAILHLRADGVRIRAVEDGVTRSIPPKASPEPDSWTTVFEVAG